MPMPREADCCGKQRGECGSTLVREGGGEDVRRAASTSLHWSDGGNGAQAKDKGRRPIECSTHRAAKSLPARTYGRRLVAK